MLSKQQYAQGGSDRFALESSVNFRYMHNSDIPGTGINKIIIMIIRYLSTPEKQECYRWLHSQKEATTKRLHHLQQKLEDVLEKQGVDVHEDLHGDLDSIMQEHSPIIASKFLVNYFPRIFWDQQQQANAAKKVQGRKWHPLMIKWCLYLRHLSSRGYEVLRNSGVISLPSQRMLRDYTHFVESAAGFSANVDEMLVEASEVLMCQVRVAFQIHSFNYNISPSILLKVIS